MADRIPEGHIKVWPRSKAVRKTMTHPVSGGFRDDDDGVFWIEDQFTFRRLEDGDVLPEQPARAKAAAEAAEQKSDPKEDAPSAPAAAVNESMTSARTDRPGQKR